LKVLKQVFVFGKEKNENENLENENVENCRERILLSRELERKQKILLSCQ